MSSLSTLTSAGAAGNLVSIGTSTLSLLPMGKALIGDPSPKPGIDGFLFDMRMSERADFSADITDHYCESNYAIEDHIAINPVRLTLTGKIAELVYKPSDKYSSAFTRALISRLTALGILKPAQSSAAMDAMAAYDVAYNSYFALMKSYEDLKGFFSDEPAKNNQQKQFKVIEGYFNQRSLLTVETPWRHFKNMAIESWSAEQNEESVYESIFTINFKEMNFIETETMTGFGVISRITGQKSDSKNKGTQQGSEASVAKKTFNP